MIFYATEVIEATYKAAESPHLRGFSIFNRYSILLVSVEIGGTSMRAVIYIRVSDDEQVKEGYSIESQDSVCSRWIVDKKFELVDKYVDEGKSAKNMKRSELQRLMRDIHLKRFDIIVFWRLNRLTRNLKDKIHLFELCEKHGIQLKSMTEEIDTTTASGRMVTNLLVSVAQGEREQIGENVFGTMYEMAVKGKRQGAVAPYGYDLEDGKLIINVQEAEVVRRIYELYQAPMSTRAISKLFNSEGLRKRGGAYWSDFMVHYILSNPTYCGKLRWNYRKASGKRTHREIIVDNTHEGIVSVELFDRIEKMRNKRAIKREKVSSDFHFTGVLRCGRCGYGMIGLTQRDNKTGNSRRFYRCLGRANYGVCNMPIVQERIIVDMFLEAMDEGSEHLRKLVPVNEYVPVDEDFEQEQLKRDLEQIQKRRRKWQEAYANDAITLEELKSHNEEERAREESLKAKLEPAVGQEKSQWEPDEIKEMLKTLRPLWHEIKDEAAKKKFVQDIFISISINSPIEKAVARPGKTIPIEIKDIVWNI